VAAVGGKRQPSGQVNAAKGTISSTFQNSCLVADPRTPVALRPPVLSVPLPQQRRRQHMQHRHSCVKRLAARLLPAAALVAPSALLSLSLSLSLSHTHTPWSGVDEVLVYIWCRVT
jgi:hypothetical protein